MDGTEPMVIESPTAITRSVRFVAAACTDCLFACLVDMLLWECLVVVPLRLAECLMGRALAAEAISRTTAAISAALAARLLLRGCISLFGWLLGDGRGGCSLRVVAAVR